MADEVHMMLLPRNMFGMTTRESVTSWNKWREENPDEQPDLSEAKLSGCRLWRINFRNANLQGAILNGTQLLSAILRDADLRGAQLHEANLFHADLRNANLTGAHLMNCNITGANLDGAILHQANLIHAEFNNASLRGAKLTETDLSFAIFDKTDLKDADISNSKIYGTSVWSVDLSNAMQKNLVISQSNEPTITVDNLEVAQFIYLLSHNERIRDVIDTITSKVVLILGRFTLERKKVLEAIRNELRKNDYLPVLFDFEKPSSRDFIETVATLAHLACFVIADVTEPKIVLEELPHIVRNISVPVKPLLLQGSGEEPVTLYNLRINHQSLLETFLYPDTQSLLADFQSHVIAPLESKVKELREKG